MILFNLYIGIGLFFRPIFLWPVTTLYKFAPRILKGILPAIHRRLEFENRNFLDEHAKSFRIDGRRAQYAFEFSSEGEFEQVKSLITILLKSGHSIELIYCSESIEAKVVSFMKLYPASLRGKRMPLLSYSWSWFSRFWTWNSSGQNLNRWMTAPTLILCRYDFFPEFFYYFNFPGRKICLLSATVKSKPQSLFPNPLAFYFWSSLFKRFSLITTSLDGDVEKVRMLMRLDTYDKRPIFPLEMRVLSIADRLSVASSTLCHKITGEHLNYFKQHNVFLVAQAHLEDLKILFSDEVLTGQIYKNTKVVIIPHNMKIEVLMEMELFLNNQLAKHKMMASGNLNMVEGREEKDVLIWPIKGVLCEIYTLVSQCYLGGGFGVSIHSVMEPILAGCRVTLGPVSYRSTELDWALEKFPQKIHLLLDQRIKCMQKKNFTNLKFLQQCSQGLGHFLRSNEQLAPTQINNFQDTIQLEAKKAREGMMRVVDCLKQLL